MLAARPMMLPVRLGTSGRSRIWISMPEDPASSLPIEASRMMTPLLPLRGTILNLRSSSKSRNLYSENRYPPPGFAGSW